MEKKYIYIYISNWVIENSFHFCEAAACCLLASEDSLQFRYLCFFSQKYSTFIQVSIVDQSFFLFLVYPISFIIGPFPWTPSSKAINSDLLFYPSHPLHILSRSLCGFHKSHYLLINISSYLNAPFISSGFLLLLLHFKKFNLLGNSVFFIQFVKSCSNGWLFNKK